jgi:hypothetical protein
MNNRYNNFYTEIPISTKVVLGVAELLVTRSYRNSTRDLYRCELDGTVNYVEIKRVLSINNHKYKKLSGKLQHSR